MLGDLDLSFTFLWCPGHTGIEGNEEGDAAARYAADSPEVETISIRHDDAK